MKALEEKILKEGTVVSGNILKVGSFLNQQIDPEFMTEIGKEIYRLYKDSGVTKIFTIEASGIAIALAAACQFKVPAVFAKKSKSSNIAHEMLSVPVKSFTRNTVYEVSVSSEYICKGDILKIKNNSGRVQHGKRPGRSVSGDRAVKKPCGNRCGAKTL